MAVRIPWDKYEAAILLDGLVQVLENKILRKEAISNISDKLRQRAVYSGLEIDEKFRNIAGISMQLSVMEHIYTGGLRGLKKSTMPKLFIQTIDLYRNNRYEFKTLLAEAVDKITEKNSMNQQRTNASGEINMKNQINNENDFFDWLKNSFSEKKVSDIIKKGKIISMMLLKKKIIDMPVFTYQDVDEITHIKNMAAKCFAKSASRKDAIKIFDLYGSFLNQRNIRNSVLQSSNDDKRTNLVSIEESIESNATQQTSKNYTMLLDLRENNDLVYTKPVSFSYFGVSNSDIKNWTQLYVDLLKCLLKDYSDSILKYINSSLSGKGRFDFADEEHMPLMTAPKKVAENFYVETNLSANNILQKIKQIVDSCQIDANNIRIEYISKRNIGNTINAHAFVEKIAVEIPDSLIDECNLILIEFFEDGYRIGNYMHQKRFLNIYDEKFSQALNKTPDELDELLKHIGLVIDDRVFSYDGTSCNETINEVIDCIITAFSEGASVIYYECLFEKFKDVLVGSNIYSHETLKNVLQNNDKLNKYRFNKNYINQYNRNDDIVSEISQILISSPIPVSYSDIQSKLWYVPLESIKNAVNRVPGKAYVGNSSFIYAPNFNISSSELSSLINAMNNSIYSKGYVVAKDLYELFIEYCPMSAMDASNYKDIAIREILRILIGDKFNFSTSVITQKGVSLTYGDIYENFAKEHNTLNIEEIKMLSEELGTQIYWSSILKEMIQISPTEFVNKSLFEFDIDAIDAYLESICEQDYAVLKDINLFISFPPINYKWNGFILYGYISLFSKKFILKENGYNENDYFGIMLKVDSELKSFDEIAADYLSKDNTWRNEKEAISCLVNAKFQRGRSCKNIASIVKKAKQKRNEN